jgi:type II secretory pathway pseudopilin PulG
MQRKNNLLKTSHRSAIAMIMAISVIVIISTIMALSLALTTQTTKRTADLYIYEQAVLLSKSAAEYALLQISLNPPCSQTNLNFSEDYYDINVSMRYIYTVPSPCASSTDTYFSIATPEQNGSVLMDITVSVDNTTVVNEPIRYFRRSIQKL